jgi:hypothetical protein
MVDGPNVEYPWPALLPDGRRAWIALADADFAVARSLRQTTDGQDLLKLLRMILNDFERFFPA